jgi:hypothetical protein
VLFGGYVRGLLEVGSCEDLTADLILNLDGERWTKTISGHVFLKYGRKHVVLGGLGNRWLDDAVMAGLRRVTCPGVKTEKEAEYRVSEATGYWPGRSAFSTEMDGNTVVQTPKGSAESTIYTWREANTRKRSRPLK